MKTLENVMFCEENGLCGRFGNGDYAVLPEEKAAIAESIDRLFAQSNQKGSVDVDEFILLVKLMEICQSTQDSDVLEICCDINWKLDQLARLPSIPMAAGEDWPDSMKKVGKVLFDERDGLNGRFRDEDYTVLPEERAVIGEYLDRVLAEENPVIDPKDAVLILLILELCEMTMDRGAQEISRSIYGRLDQLRRKRAES